MADEVDVPDERALAITPVHISIEEIVGQAALERAWLLIDLEGQRPQFETFEHEDVCNLNPGYRSGCSTAPPNICDRRCIEKWRVRNLKIR